MPEILLRLWLRVVRRQQCVRLTPEAADIMERHGIYRQDATAVSAFVLQALDLWLAHRSPNATWRPADPTALLDVILAHYDTLY